MALSTELKDAARLLADGLNAGSGTARAQLGGGGPAFAGMDGLVPTVANYVETATSEGMTFPVTLVTESGTPASIVAEGGLKPTAAAITGQDVTLSKFGGLGIATLEQHLNATGLASALAKVLSGSALKAFEADSINVLDAAAGDTVTGTTWVAATAAAQASLLASGNVPSVLIISAADYAAFTDDVLGTSAFAQDPNSPVGALLGTPIHVSSGATSGKAFMVDAGAVVAAAHEQSPILIADAVSLADTNRMRLVVDVVAKTFVTDPSGVVEITAPV